MLEPTASTASFKTMTTVSLDTRGTFGNNALVTPTWAKRDLSASERITIFAVIVLPNVLFIVLFSRMGYGYDLYNEIAFVMERSSLFVGWFLFFLSFIIALTLVCFGAHKSRFTVWLFSVPWSLFVGSLFLFGPNFPWTPMLLLPAHKGLFIGWLRAKSGPEVPRRRFFTWVFVVSCLCTAAMLMAWIAWARQDEPCWTPPAREQLAMRISSVYRAVYKRPLDYAADCGPSRNHTAVDLKESLAIDVACGKASTLLGLVWFSPVVCIMSNVMVCLFVFCFGMSLNEPESAELQYVLKRYVLLLGLMLFGIYTSAIVTEAGASMRLGGFLRCVFLLGIVLSLGWMYYEVGPHRLSRYLDERVNERLKNSKLVEMFRDLRYNEWFQALMLLPVSMLLPAAYTVQRFCGSGQHPNWLIVGLQWIIKEQKSWHWPMLLCNLCIASEAFFLFSVGVSKVTPVFLSWLNDRLVGVAFNDVLVLVFVIGFLMFMLPPVPGLPVFVFTGIVLAKQGIELENLGFWAGTGIACVMSLAMKLLACVGQYYIGYLLGQSVKIQQMIGVNTVNIRAIEFLLKEPGLGFGKVMILTGGPDWPTSVLCGILRVDIIQMLIGTLPVVFITTTCTFAGAFQTQTVVGVKTFWNTWAAVSTIAAVCAVLGSTCVALLKITEVIESRADELSQPREDHRAVVELTLQEESYNQIYRQVVRWDSLGHVARFVVCSATWMLVASCGAFAGLSGFLFRDFAVSGRIDDPFVLNGLDGDWLNVVIWPHGWAALAIFAGGVVLHVLFALYATMLARAQVRREASECRHSMVEMPESSVWRVDEVEATRSQK